MRVLAVLIAALLIQPTPPPLTGWCGNPARIGTILNCGDAHCPDHPDQHGHAGSACQPRGTRGSEH
jgi:hypothetical protein